MRHLTAGLLLTLVASAAVADDAFWARRLGSSSPHLAQAAVAHFAAQGPPAVPVLVGVLDGKDLLARQYAAAALGRLALPGADKALLRALMTTQDLLLQQFCAEALAARGAAIVPLLRHALLLDAPAPPDHPLTRADDEAEYRRSAVIAVIYDLPPALALPLCADYVSRPEGNRNDAAKVLLLSQGAAGMRLWATSFLAQTGLPDVAAANRAWDAGRDEWDAFLQRWTIGNRWTPAPYEVALYDEPDKQADRAMVRQIAEEARQSPSAAQRLWGYSHLAVLTPEEDAPRLLRQALSDPCWMIPAMFLNGPPPPGDEAEAYQALAPTLRQLASSPCRALRFAAAQMMAGAADPAAPAAFAAILRDGSDRDHEEVGWAISAYTPGWTDAMRLELLEPLLAVNRTKRGATWTCNALGTMPASAWPRLVGLLQSPRVGVREGGAELAGLTGAQDAVPDLEQALDDPAERVRLAALNSLADLLHEGAAPYLRRLLDRGGERNRRLAYGVALRAEAFGLVAQMILAHPELTTPPRSPDDDREYGFGFPAVRETREDISPSGEAHGIRTTLIPEILGVAQRLFADAKQPVRVRLTAAEAILKAGLPEESFGGPGGPGGPPPPGGGKTGEAPSEAPLRIALCQDSEIPADAKLPAELWPALQFALMHYPRGISWGPNEAEPILRAARLVRDPAAVPTLLQVLQANDYGEPKTPFQAPRNEWELTSAVVFSLLQIKPEGETAFWRLVETAADAMQIALVQAARGGWWGTPPALAEKTQAAWLRALQRPEGLRSLPSDLAQIFPPGAPAAAEARKLLREAYAHWALPRPTRADLLRALANLQDPDADRLVVQLLSRRDPGPDRRQALWLLKRLQSPAVLRMAVALANSDFEEYGTRYRALRAVEQRDPALVREIATRWTRDSRYELRHLGRLLLVGEEQMYL